MEGLVKDMEHPLYTTGDVWEMNLLLVTVFIQKPLAIPIRLLELAAMDKKWKVGFKPIIVKVASPEVFTFPKFTLH